MTGLLFTYLMTYGGAVVALFNPYIGLLIYISFAILRPDFLWAWIVPPGNYSRIIAIALLIGWALKGFGSWSFGRAQPIVFALLGFWAWSLFSALVIASDRSIGLHFVEEFSKIALPFFVGATVVDSVPKLKLLAWVIVYSIGYVAFEQNLCYLQGVNVLAMEGFGSMDNNCFAIALVSCLGPAFFLGITPSRWWLQVGAFACVLLMAHAVLFSNSRGGMLAMILVGVFAFYLLPKRAVHYLIFALAVAVVLRLAGEAVQDRFMTVFASGGARDSSAQGRLDLWAGCLQVMMSNPLGVGPDHWTQVSTRLGFVKGKHAHTLWLQIGAELGFPGLLLLLYYYAGSLARLWRITKPEYVVTDPWLREAARMVVASLIGFMISAQFVSLPGLEVPYYIVLLGVGVLKLAPPPGFSCAASVPTTPEEGSVAAALEQEHEPLQPRTAVP